MNEVKDSRSSEKKLFDTYYEALKESFCQNQASVQYNSDRAHNATIMCFMLDNSQSIKMYCGKMSIFRDNFYSKIEREHQDESGIGEYIKSKVESSLEMFLRKAAASLTIVFEKEQEDNFNDILCHDIFLESVKNGKIKLFYLPVSFTTKTILNHFTIADTTMFRFEDDKEQHSAICSFHSTEDISMLSNNFDILSKVSQPQPFLF